jgi:hypothetical protein
MGSLFENVEIEFGDKRYAWHNRLGHIGIVQDDGIRIGFSRFFGHQVNPFLVRLLTLQVCPLMGPLASMQYIIIAYWHKGNQEVFAESYFQMDQ